MAVPIAVTNGAQTYDYGELPVDCALDGSGSFDPDGDPITAYQWTLVDKPPGSAAVIANADQVEASLQADVVGSYLCLLVVTADGEESVSDLEDAPESAFARISVRTQHAQFELPATGEPGWGDRHNANWRKVDEMQAALNAAEAALTALTDALAAHAALQTAHWPKADTVNYGVVRVSAPPSPAGTPTAVATTDENWDTLTAGGEDADPLHEHPAIVAQAAAAQAAAAAAAQAAAQVASDLDDHAADGDAHGKSAADWGTLTGGGSADALHTHGIPPGRHHFLRHDLLVGASDRTWTAQQVAALALSSAKGGTRLVHASRDADNVLQVDCEKADTNNLAGVLWAGAAGDWEATLDLRLFLSGPGVGAATPCYLAAGFAWMDADALGAARKMRGAGIVCRNASFAEASVGGLHLPDATLWNAVDPAFPALAPVATVGLVTELMVRLVRQGATTWAEVSVGGGGFFPVPDAAWDDGGGGAGFFALFGSLKSAAVGLKIKSTGFRLRAQRDKWFGA